MLYAEDFRRIAREALSGKWALAVGTGFIAALLGGISSGGSSSGSGNSRNNLEASNRFFHSDMGEAIFPFFIGFIVIIGIWLLITFILGGAIELGYSRFNKNLIKRTNPQFGDLFSRFDIFWKALGLRIITTIFIILWTLLLIIPGIIAAYRYSMAFYIMDDDPSIGILEAIDKSKEMMRGNKARLFCLHLSFIGWAFLCLFTCGIGFLWLTPYIYAANAAFYLEISGQRGLLEEPIIA